MASLCSTNTETIPEIPQCIIGEIKTLNSPPCGLKNTITAFLILLGYPENDAEDWGICRYVVSKTLGDDSIMQQILKFDPKKCCHDVALNARRVLISYTLDEIKNQNCATAAIYDWTKAMIYEVMARKEG